MQIPKHVDGSSFDTWKRLIKLCHLHDQYRVLQKVRTFGPPHLLIRAQKQPKIGCHHMSTAASHDVKTSPQHGQAAIDIMDRLEKSIPRFT